MIRIVKINTKSFFEDSEKNVFISKSRKQLLVSVAEAISKEFVYKNRANINFICTHNSRRSQLSQVWSFFAIEYFGLSNIFSYSGGTEATVFHRNTVKTLQKVGFEFSVVDFSHQNPRYLITFKNTNKTILGFSKVFDDNNNKSPYIAITTCDSAEKNCPFIPDAIGRFHLPYKDPKSADNTQFQNDKYLETSQLIAAEMFFIFKQVKGSL